MPKDITKSGPNRAGNATDDRGRRRSERVVLRVTLQLSAKMPDGKRINIDVHSLVVNAHGGLLEVGMELVRGQHIILNNAKTEKAVTGTVLRVEGLIDGRFSVAFEFEFPAPSFWPVVFPPSDWTSNTQAA
jgi:hypothetical protein